jgi:hypothetical protein
VINRNDGSNADWTQAAIVMGGTEGDAPFDVITMLPIGGESTKSSSCEKIKKFKKREQEHWSA